MYFNHSFRKTLLGTNPFTPSTATATSALTAGQLGLYDSSYAAFTYAAAATTKPFYLVQGSYFKTTGYSDSIGAQGGYQESVKSKMINPKYISRIFWVAAKAPVQQVVQIPLTAASGATNVGLNADTTYRLRLDVKGSPALRYLSHNLYRVMDTYTGPANATNPTYFKDPVATLVDWKEQINSSPYFNQLVQARAYSFKNNATSTHFTAGTPGVSSTTLTITTSNTGVILPGQRIVGSTGVTGLTTVPNVFANYGTAFGTATSTAVTGNATTVTLATGTPTGTITVGMYAVGAGLPQGAYVSNSSTQTALVITYPNQGTGVTPAILGLVTFYNTIVLTYPTQTTAPTFSSWTIKCYSDLYGANGGSTLGFVNNVITGSVLPTYVGQTAYIPGSLAYNTAGLAQSSVATGAVITAASTVAAATSAAHVYTASADAASFTTDAFMELTCGYLETKFGAPTFTVSDNFDVEPLKIIASMMDDSGSTVMTAPIGTAALQTIGVAGIATEVQTASQAQGTGETVLRELILTGRYRQEAFGDGVNIDTFRMREAEANPGVLSMLTVANRYALYNKLCILHTVPRFNNPSGVFDNDQYLLEIAVPQAIGLGSFFATATTTTGKLTTITNGAGSLFGDYIAAAANVANGASGGTIASTAAIIPVEVF